MSTSTRTAEKPRTASTVFDCLRTSAATSLVRLGERAGTPAPAASPAREPAPTGKLLSDAERERARGLLTDAYLAGRLDEPEYDARVGRAYGARRQSQLDAALEGLPAPVEPTPAAAPKPAPKPAPAEREDDWNGFDKRAYASEDTAWWTPIAGLLALVAVLAAVIGALFLFMGGGSSTDGTLPAPGPSVSVIPDRTPANAVRTLVVFYPDGAMRATYLIRGPVRSVATCGLPDPDGADCTAQQSATTTTGKPVNFSGDYLVSDQALKVQRRTGALVP